MATFVVLHQSGYDNDGRILKYLLYVKQVYRTFNKAGYCAELSNLRPTRQVRAARWRLKTQYQIVESIKWNE